MALRASTFFCRKQSQRLGRSQMQVYERVGPLINVKRAFDRVQNCWQQWLQLGSLLYIPGTWTGRRGRPTCGWRGERSWASPRLTETLLIPAGSPCLPRRSWREWRSSCRTSPLSPVFFCSDPTINIRRVGAPPLSVFSRPLF